MKLMRLAICVAAFAVVGGIAVSEDLDVKALQAKLAAQEARLNDLQAKMYAGNCDGNVADSMTSLRKNATVTLGGTVNTRYFYRSSKLRSSLARLDDVGARSDSRLKRADAKAGDFRVSDVKLEMKVDVNEHFDAYIKMDVQSSGDSASDNAQNAWIRWKNICNTGFGVLAGRDSMKYGMAPTVGVLDSYSGVNDGPTWDAFGGFGTLAAVPAGTPWSGEGMFVNGNILPTHTAWDESRTTQLTPYWENCDGSFKAELSFMQASNLKNGLADRSEVAGNVATGRATKYRSINYGLGTMSGRITWKPVEGLKIVASALNRYAKQRDGYWTYPSGNDWNVGTDFETSNNNFAASLGVEYNPCFLSKLTVWGYYQHGWNEGWVKDMDSDLVNAGLKFDITDQFYTFAQGDYLYVKNSKATTWHKSKAWAAYAGFGYTLPYGVNFETGYRHDNLTFEDRAGRKHTKYKTDTIYAHLGFDF